MFLCAKVLFLAVLAYIHASCFVIYAPAIILAAKARDSDSVCFMVMDIGACTFVLGAAAFYIIRS